MILWEKVQGFVTSEEIIKFGWRDWEMLSGGVRFDLQL